jgi:hypothetical protein
MFLTQIHQALFDDAEVAFTLLAGGDMVLSDLRPTTFDVMGFYKFPDAINDFPVQADFKTALVFPPLIGVIAEYKRNVEQETGIASPGPTANRASIDKNDPGVRIAGGKTMRGC